jgi:hypothetical protein
MMKYFLLTIGIFSLLSCSEIEKATEEQLERAIATHPYDSTYIDDVSRYYQIKNFIESNIDTLMKYRDSKHKVISIGKNTVDTLIVPQDCHCFAKNTSHDLKSAPPLLQNSLKWQWEQIGMMNRISFCKDGEISIVVNSELIQDGVYAIHKLIWHETINPNHRRYTKEKSIKINENWTYRIGLIENYGW